MFKLLIICDTNNCNSGIAVRQFISKRFNSDDILEIIDLNFHRYDSSKKYNAQEQEICKKIPYVDSLKCKYCGKCIEYCKIGGITLNKLIPLVTFNKTNCLSCFACQKACNIAAIMQKDYQIGISVTHKPVSNQIFKTYYYKNIELYKKNITKNFGNDDNKNLKIGIINHENLLLLKNINSEEIISDFNCQNQHI